MHEKALQQEFMKLISAMRRDFLSGLCDREHWQRHIQGRELFLSGLCDRELEGCSGWVGA